MWSVSHARQKVATFQDQVEGQRGSAPLYQSPRVLKLKNLFNEFHLQSRKAAVAPDNTAFCEEALYMSGTGIDTGLNVLQPQEDDLRYMCSIEKPFGCIDLTSEELVGERLFPNGDIYVGCWHGNLPEGKGKYLWSDGTMYEGEWVKGKKSGKGRISWPSGATYEGDFMAGYIHGVGTYTGVDNTTYRGSWYMNEKRGLGTKSYANGDVYEGSWNQGVPDGMGKYLWKNGNEYVGEWKSGAMCGKGTLTWACVDKYNGQWLDGVEHGHGIYTWVDGSSYVGTWSRGLKDGKGTFFPRRSSCPGHPLSNIQESEVLGTEGYRFGASQIPRNSSACEKEYWNARVCRVSSHGSSVDKVTGSETTGSDNGLENCPSFEKSCSFDDSFDRIVGQDDDEHDDATTMHDDEQDSFIALTVVREYVQGVLINEFVKERSSIAKSPKRRPRHHIKEPVKPGETIFKGHQSYDLMLNLQLGIRYTVGKITPEPRREISTADFGPKARIWMHFPREGSQLTPPHQSTDFKWKDYCPVVFRYLRELFKIDTADYMLSICGNSGLRELSSPGKSGSVFYLSHDDRFMIKTMRKAEVKVLLGMLPNYYDHVQKFENTLITKFFGLHRIKPAGGQKVRFVVMGNMFCTELRIHRRFDLKGSSQGRSADKLEMDENTTLKDLDLDFVFRLEPSWRQDLLRQIDCDCKFLESERIMDYSLLLGLHFRAPQFPAIFSSEPSCQADTAVNGVKDETVNEAAQTPSNGLVLVAHKPQKSVLPAGSHVRGSPLRAPAAGNKEVDLLLPGTARLRVQLGVNMPARADRRPRGTGKDQEFGEVYDVVLYLGIIDILQEYDVGKKLEHAYKSLQFDSLSISAVDPSLYSKRFQDFIRKTFPDSWD
ncbi:hypothetical protein GOP47_0000627 [Adiantum capillus-veneris]|uniref:1-phosphatidylinositol-4-phosphate 5-kinase n=1 Tax=Adiantum capillus-veneris TaxID=13818 RepID=A0A9D4ZQW2_ADICA|nr:hypothetical protein GOP47_0000627 [Adiantum capillus-veneris]